MPKMKFSRNAPCPCGSGKKYKQCCIDRGLEWTSDEKGQIYKSVPLNEEAMKILEKQRKRFIKKYGREPNPGDPIFFDLPDDDEIERLAVEAMKAAKIDPALIYAYKKIGLMVTENNKPLLSDRDLAEWNAAINEYDSGH